ncbi:hypothetical protein ACFQY0_00105 [Haloferula chungangensis]|uniref:Uncharacterized protein n=1 Tax=Haloferula chungangensis TaxID=1048331 RepID=A0ABW2L1X0_9BACT
MTTEEIQQYINDAVSSKFDGYEAQSMEMMTSEGGDGRFFGKVFAIRYSGLPNKSDVYLAVGQSEQGAQIVKLGMSECLTPQKTELDFLLQKELGIVKDESGGE